MTIPNDKEFFPIEKHTNLKRQPSPSWRWSGNGRAPGGNYRLFDCTKPIVRYLTDVINGCGIGVIQYPGINDYAESRA